MSLFSEIMRRLERPARKRPLHKIDLREYSQEELERAVRSIPTHYVEGPRALGASSTATGYLGREDKTAAVVFTPAHGRWHEASSRGYLFAGTAASGGIAPGTTLTTTACLCLYNPVASGRIVSVLRRGADYVSGTLGTGNLYDCVNTSTTQTVPTGTALTVSNLNIGNTTAQVATALSAATVVAPVAVGVICYIPPMLASSVLYLVSNYADLHGAITLKEGTSYQMQAVAAGGSTPKILPWVWWEEVPIP